MFDVILAIQCGNVRATESTTTLVTQKVQPSEVVSLTQGKLARPIVRVDREELGGDDFTAILSKDWG
jgi:hypothetical protein